MKRIQEACICQTLHFMLKEDFGHKYAVDRVKEEGVRYKESLERSRTKYKILEESTLPDDSVVIKIIRQYNGCPVGHYLD